MPKHILIIGGGYTGLSAAFDLVKAGNQVTILEQDDQLGGLAGTFELQPGIRIEKFYHHWFSSDYDILNLIKELGLYDQLKRVSTNTGLYYANSIFRLASPLDLLKFKPLPFIDRIRTGIMALVARRISDWKPLESQSAADWIRKYAGKKSFKVIWEPLIKGKFGKYAEEISAVWFWNKIKLRGSSRNEKAAEELVYFEGGFGKVTDALEKFLLENGATIKKSCPVTRIIEKDGAAVGVETSTGIIAADKILVTTPLPVFLKLLPTLPESYAAKCRAIKYIGNVCLTFRLKRSLSSTYWLNVSDPSFPFVGIIEHTNLDEKSKYGNEHIAFISKYLPTDDALFKLSDDEYFEYCLPFVQKIFPEFTRDWLHGFRCWRAEYSQPIITKHYSEMIPSFETPVKNLYLATMAQVYPEDRGTNYAVREGRKVAKVLHAKKSV